jgi:hypothetical protein
MTLSLTTTLIESRTSSRNIYVVLINTTRPYLRSSSDDPNTLVLVVTCSTCRTIFKRSAQCCHLTIDNAFEVIVPLESGNNLFSARE